MEITHLGHSCVLIEVADQRILLDPGWFSDVSDQRDLTAVLVTHRHPDHVDPDALPALLEANPDAQVWMDGGTVGPLADAHDGRAQPLTPGEPLRLGAVTVSPVGEQHALIHDYVPRISNTGLVLRAEGEPSLFHPGDALDAEPGTVDVLCVPINAPWAKVAETIAFVRRIAPPRIVPIHDGLLNERGRNLYLGQIADNGAQGGVEVLDLRGRGRTRV